jgi:hypothetical protein
MRFDCFMDALHTVTNVVGDNMRFSYGAPSFNRKQLLLVGREVSMELLQ